MARKPEVGCVPVSDVNNQVNQVQIYRIVYPLRAISQDHQTLLSLSCHSQDAEASCKKIM